MRRPTQNDVAIRAGVSKATVGFALSDRYDISIPESTRLRIKRAAEEIGYRPNLAARALASGRTSTATIAFPGKIEAYHSQVLQVFERLTNARGYHLIATTIGHIAPSNALSDLSDLLAAPNDAVVLVDVFDQYRPYVEELVPTTKPILSMGIVDLPALDTVHVDLLPAVLTACEHLCISGRDHVVYFGANIPIPEIPTWIDHWSEGRGDPRCSGYCRAMNSRGLEPRFVGGRNWDREGTIAALKDYIDRHGCPDAMICTNDVLAIRVHGALRRMGYQIPKDIRIVGCDGIEVGEDLEPALSTIVQPVQEMCAIGWDVLETRLASPDMPRQYKRLTADFVVRQSSLEL